MKIVKQSVNILYAKESPTKHIEKIGRICYKSEDKIGDGTDIKFVKMLHNKHHYAMLEHYRFIMQVSPKIYDALSVLALRHFEFSSYNDRLLISFNVTALIELQEKSRGSMFGYIKMAQAGIYDELVGHILEKYDCYELLGIDRNSERVLLSTNVKFINNTPLDMSKEEYMIHGWKSVHFVTDRGISHEIVRHREETSFAQESTRYCSYNNKKFGNEITVIDAAPILFGLNSAKYNIWERSCLQAERNYFNLIEEGATPQEARSVLPTSLKTEIVMTAPMYEWEHFFNLRMRGTTGEPHPMIKSLSTALYEMMWREED